MVKNGGTDHRRSETAGVMTSATDGFLVAQLGARMHYAVPRILHAAGRLSRLLTDACTSRGPLRVLHCWPERWRPPALRRWTDRRPTGIPPGLIRANNLLGLRYARAYARTRTALDRVRLFLRTGREFNAWAIRQDWGDPAGVFVYNTAGVEILAEARNRGLRGVVEQTIAPYAVERAILTEELSRYPAWDVADEFGPEIAEYEDRERREWASADVVLCGSEFVRDGVISQGGDPNRAVVVPYGVDARFDMPPAADHDGPLRVLTVGQVGLRKGTPYAVEAARRLRGLAEFRWVGAFKLRPEAKPELGSDVNFTGPVPRSEVFNHYAWADVFVLPSLVEGSATSTYEAMTAGRPVVCTPNCGSVVRDGLDGYIVPVRDVEALVERIERLAADADLRRTMARSARERAAAMNYDAYARGLLQALDRPAS